MCGCKAASLTSTKDHSNNCIKGRALRGPFLNDWKPVALRRGKAATCSCFPVVLTQSTLQGHSVPCTTDSYSPATSLPSRQHGQPLQNSPAGQSALLHNQQLPRFRPDYTPPPSVCTACTLCRDATVTCLFFGSHWHPVGILGHVQLYAQHGQSPVNQEN